MLLKFSVFLKAVRRSLIAATTVIGVLYLWPDIKGLPGQFGYSWGWLMPEQQTITYVALGLALGWIFWMDVRRLIKQWWRSRSQTIPSTIPVEELRPEIRQLLNNIASLSDFLQEPWSHDLEHYVAGNLFVDIKAAKADVFYDEAAHGVLGSLVLQFDIAMELKDDKDEHADFETVCTNLRETTMLFARLVGAPVKYHPDKDDDSQSRQDTGQEKPP